MDESRESIFLNPKFAARILSHLGPVDIDRLLVALPPVQFTHNPLLRLHDNVKALFSLYGDREPGKQKPIHAAYQACASDYKPLQNSILRPAPNSVGFIVMIPVPFNKNYKPGSDQHPITLIQRYVNAIAKLYPGNPPNDQAMSSFVRSKIRIVIGLNIKDNHYDSKYSSHHYQQAINRFSDHLNQEILKAGYPAYVIPLVWGIDQLKRLQLKHLRKEMYPHHEVSWLNTRADQIRAHLDMLSGAQKGISMSFP